MMKVTKRFFLAPSVFLIFLYLFYTAYKDVKDRTLNEFNSQQFALANQASIGIESFFSYYQKELTGLSKISFISDLNDQGMSLLTDFYQNHSGQIAAISVVDAKGILIFTYPYIKDVIGQDLSKQNHVKKVIETRKPTVSDVFTSVQGYRAIAYHIPIMSGNEYKGSLAILIPIDKLGQRFIEPIKTGKTGYGMMISENGTELFNPIPGHSGKSIKETYNGNQSVLDLFDKTFFEEKGTTICNTSPETGKNKKLSKTFAAFYRVSLDNTFWTILIFTPEQEVYASLAAFRDRLLILFSLFIIVMITYFYLSFKASAILREEKRRRALEIILHESEKRFRTMFELSPAGMILIDKNGSIIEVNSTFCETVGYSRKELISKNIRLFASPGYQTEVENNISEILSGKTLKHEVTNIRKDGTTCEVELYETMINLPDGKPGILSVSNDITEKKRSQEKMMTLSRALESIGECVSITDRENKIIFVNNAFCKTYQYDQKELIGENISIVRPVNDPNVQLQELLSDTIPGGWSGELMNVKKDGTEFPVELSTAPIRDEKGNTIALIGISIDITERKKAHKELISAKEKAEESDKLKSAFIANMSHELRTPLNAIIGFSGLMIETLEDEENISNVKVILNSGLHLLSLVEDILDISMIETGQIKIDYEKIEINSILSQVKDIIQGEQLKENKNYIKLILKVDPGIVETYLFSDKRKIKQVLINLLKNSLKFTDKGYIEFGYSVIEKNDNKYLKFYVKDTGIGIDKKHHPVIFDNFRQIDDTQTRRFGGMGIGLSVAKKIIEMLGGEIWVESELGKGSIFYFTVPQKSEKLETERNFPDTTGSKEDSFIGKTILIVEDEASNYEFLRIFFTKMSVRVLWAKDGLEAVSLCETDPSISLVFMDIKLPLLNGLDAAKRIKKGRPELPIIAQTAYAMISDKEEALNAGCDDYLSKPIQQKRLNDIIKKYFRGKSEGRVL
ncbi:MAG: PAS domain S-box protein [Bacteroidales bacterium]|jgi:PAS domain S-box-containing protein